MYCDLWLYVWLVFKSELQWHAYGITNFDTAGRNSITQLTIILTPSRVSYLPIVLVYCKIHIKLFFLYFYHMYFQVLNLVMMIRFKQMLLLISHLLKFNIQFVIFFAGRKSKMTSYVIDQKEKENNYALTLLRKNQNCLDDMSIYKRVKNLNGSVSITVYTAIFLLDYAI